MSTFASHYHGPGQEFQGFVPMEQIPEERALILDSAAPWDEAEQPEIVDWNSLRSMVENKIKERDAQRASGICHWPWIVARHFGLDYANPYQRVTDCAGFATIASSEDTVLQQIADGARLDYIKYNPTPTWKLGRYDAGYNGGGATLGMMLKSTNKYGCFPVSVAGDYDLNYNKSESYWRNMDSEGKRFQSSVCYLGNLKRQDMFDAVMMSCRAGLKVVMGSNRKMGAASYSNGIKVCGDGGSTAHATCLNAWREHNGKQYLFEKGSWGAYYKNGSMEREQTPECGGWISQDFVWQRTGTSFADFFVVVYSESFSSKSDWNLLIPQITFPV